jgi:hypothetical protein
MLQSRVELSRGHWNGAISQKSMVQPQLDMATPMRREIAPWLPTTQTTVTQPARRNTQCPTHDEGSAGWTTCVKGECREIGGAAIYIGWVEEQKLKAVLGLEASGVGCE